jgi:hypothetical protein
MKTFSVAYKLTAGKGEEGDVTLYTVEAARVFKLRNISTNFPSGQAFKLEISIFRGMKQVAPSVGVYSGDGSVIKDESDEEFQSGERIIAHYKNTDTANAQSCFILLTGEFIS